MPFKFEFTATGLTRAEADALLAFIIEEAEYYAAEIGGGFVEVTENGDALAGEPGDGSTNAKP